MCTNIKLCTIDYHPTVRIIRGSMASQGKLFFEFAFLEVGKRFLRKRQPAPDLTKCFRLIKFSDFIFLSNTTNNSFSQVFQIRMLFQIFLELFK